MIKLFFVIASFILTQRQVSATFYNCTFGPDATGGYSSEIVDSGVAAHCGLFCSCVGLMNNTCHFGPDKEGRFVTEVVSSELADQCDMSFCICDTHNFTRMQEENPDGDVVTFESAMRERQDAAVDETVKPHEDPPPNEP